MANDDGTKRNRFMEKTVQASDGFIKGSKAYHEHQGSKYKVVVDANPVCKVNVIDKTAGRNGEWVFRLDGPHHGAEFDHVNINPKISKLGYDPHLHLPPGGLSTGKGVAKVLKFANGVNKVAAPVAVVLDAAQIGYSAYEDIENGTTRNTVETVASVAGGWTAGFAGAAGGAAIGSAIFPGVGTIIGGIVGGLSGGIGGSLGASAAAEAIGDAVDYDMEEKVCKKCKRKFKVRKYRGEHNNLCPECAKTSS